MKPRILIIHDVEVDTPRGTLRWAYAHRSHVLQKYAPDDLQIDRVSHCDLDWAVHSEYDLVFALDYTQASSYRNNMKEHGSKAIYVLSFNKDTRSRRTQWGWALEAADWVIANNMNRWEHDGVKPHTCCISNGIDTQFWKPTVPFAERPPKAIWTGGTGSEKKKGYHEVLMPLTKLMQGSKFSHDFRPITAIDAKQCYTPEEMRDWYNSARFVICASATEGGGPNFVMEAMACGCVPVTTWVGGVPEYCVDGENAICVGRPEGARGFMEGLQVADASSPALSEAAVATMQQHRYDGPDGRAQYFYQLFRRLLYDGRDTIRPFSATQIPWQRI